MRFRKKVIIDACLLLILLFTGANGQCYVGPVELCIGIPSVSSRTLRFAVGWEGSWKGRGIGKESGNHDAVWIFFKYRQREGSRWSEWKHCSLRENGYRVPVGAAVEFGESQGINKGIFVKRRKAGVGAVVWQGLEVVWDTGQDGVAEGTDVEVKGYGIEMVYIPGGSFYVGDADGDAGNSFYRVGNEGRRIPYLIESEKEIGVGNKEGLLYYARETPAAGDQSGPVPAEFPKGYRGFYIMKYELSQGEYCDFLNSLTPRQRINRVSNQYGNYRMYIKQAQDGRYGCDRNNNAGRWAEAEYRLMNEDDDGQWVACHYLSWMDIAAYADWAGLRPYTELEYEKACRGPGYPVDDEYAWGTSRLGAVAMTLLQEGTEEESPDRGNSNYYGNEPQGPYRSGSYEKKGTDRESTGRSYYGIYDLSGNVDERTVTFGEREGRSYRGTHGDGELSVNGEATNDDWPGFKDGAVSGSRGSGQRGGCWWQETRVMRISNRDYGSLVLTSRRGSSGCRLARTVF